MTESAGPRRHVAGTDGNFDTNDVARIIDTGPFGYVTAGQHEIIDGINSTLLEWLGREPDSIVGQQTFQDLLAPGDRIYYDTHIRPMLAMSKEVHEIAVQLICADGSRLPVLMNSLLRVSNDGEQRVEVVVIDATERRKYEQELLRERQLAEESEARLQVMYDVVSGLAGTESAQQVVDVVSDRGERSIAGARCSVWLIEPEKTSFFLAKGGSDRQMDYRQIGDGQALAHLADGNLLVIEDVERGDVDYPRVSEISRVAGLASVAVAPLLAGGELHGMMFYGFEQAHRFSDSERKAMLSLAVQTEQALQRARSMEAERRGRARLENLFRFSSRLAGALTVDDVLQVIVGVSVDLLDASSVRLAVLSDSRTSVRFVQRVGQADDEILIDLDSNALACAVIRSGEVCLFDSVDEVRVQHPDSPLLDDEGIGRVIAVPLVRDREVLGAWVLAYSKDRPPDTDDVTLLHLFAEQASQATGRAFFHQNEAAALARAEVRLAISAALNAAITTEDVAAAITIQGRNAFDASHLAIYMTDVNLPDSLELTTSVGFEDGPNLDAAAIAHAALAMPAITKRRVPVYLEGSALDARRDGIFGGHEWGTVVLLPMSVAGNLVGLILLGFKAVDAVKPGTRVALAGLNAEADAALGRARRFELEHEVAVTLQQSMLPTDLVTFDGWTISARYEPASDHLLVGGDLYDVIRTHDDRMVVIVGDVVGHGLKAAASMGQLRSAARTLALVSSGPLEILAGLEAFARITPGVMWATLACVSIGPTGDGLYACAGHPFPILVRNDGESELLEGGRSALLGLGEESSSVAQFHMDEGNCLVLYTDGLIEIEAQNIDDGIESLQRTLTKAHATGDLVDAVEVVESILGGSTSTDDIVVVCVTRLASTSDPRLLQP